MQQVALILVLSFILGLTCRDTLPIIPLNLHGLKAFLIYLPRKKPGKRGRERRREGGSSNRRNIWVTDGILNSCIKGSVHPKYRTHKHFFFPSLSAASIPRFIIHPKAASDLTVFRGFIHIWVFSWSLCISCFLRRKVWRGRKVNNLHSLSCFKLCCIQVVSDLLKLQHVLWM